MIESFVGLLIFLAFIFASVQPTIESDKQNVLTQIDTDYQVVQIINYVRHGYHTGNFLYNLNEYKSYHVAYPYFSYPTYLGLAQMWSYGKNLRLLYPDFFESVTNENSLFIIVDELKSIESSKHILSGMIGNYPEWPYELFDETVITAINKYGSCSGCISDSKLPIEQLILNANGENSITNQTVNFVPKLQIHDEDYLLDVDSFCLEILEKDEAFIKDLYDKIIINEGLEESFLELREKVTLSTWLQGEEYYFSMWPLLYGMPFYHYYHFSEVLDVGIEELQNLMTIDNYWLFWDQYYNNLFDDDQYETAKLYVNEILKHTLDYILEFEENENQVITFMVHDNNLYSLYQVLAHKNLNNIDFGSSIRILVYNTSKEAEEDLYVQFYINEEEFTLFDCEKLCSLDKFITIIQSSMIDVKETCTKQF